jgi:hypothetical protein
MKINWEVTEQSFESENKLGYIHGFTELRKGKNALESGFSKYFYMILI